jgi:hypothetical protein
MKLLREDSVSRLRRILDKFCLLARNSPCFFKRSIDRESSPSLSCITRETHEAAESGSTQADLIVLIRRSVSSGRTIPV